MRLLHFENGFFSDDKVTLVDFSDKMIPPYNILSHTWGEPDDEITSQDILNGTGRQKPGWKKIRFCGFMATPEIQHFWLDTCCLERDDNVQLQEAINNMYHYYQDAEICYAYLSDVVKNEGLDASGQMDWRPDHASWYKSRWFQRGWTLQELIAPKTLHFYAPDGSYLGDRETQAAKICKVTGVDGRVLRGRPIELSSINERLRWAETRETSREEDVVYCLLGLLGVQMPIAYGEGRVRALYRLQARLKEGKETKYPVARPVARKIWKLVYGPPDEGLSVLIPPLARIEMHHRAAPMYREEDLGPPPAYDDHRNDCVA